mmetsp:Transcript_25782/g.41927  ORF Transcript_25782/g.41927 Transcript_25782/m.41927 type:complete len:250 (+) Transcript_25782:101-850(+)
MNLTTPFLYSGNKVIGSKQQTVIINHEVKKSSAHQAICHRDSSSSNNNNNNLFSNRLLESNQEEMQVSSLQPPQWNVVDPRSIQEQLRLPPLPIHAAAVTAVVIEVAAVIFVAHLVDVLDQCHVDHPNQTAIILLFSVEQNSSKINYCAVWHQQIMLWTRRTKSSCPITTMTSCTKGNKSWLVWPRKRGVRTLQMKILILIIVANIRLNSPSRLLRFSHESDVVTMLHLQSKRLTRKKVNAWMIWREYL